MVPESTEERWSEMATYKDFGVISYLNMDFLGPNIKIDFKEEMNELK